MGRTREFERYLESLSPDERSKVLQAEREYVDGLTRRTWSLEDIARQQMKGYEDSPAGPKHG